MTKSKKRVYTGKKPQKGIQWDIVGRVLKIAVPVTVLLFAALWYLLQPNTQYRLRRWYLTKKYGNVDAYYPQRPVIPYSYDTSTSSTHQIQYLYRLNVSAKSLEEVYQRDGVSWPAQAYTAGNSVYISDGKSVSRFDQESRKVTRLYGSPNTKLNVRMIPSPDGGVYVSDFPEDMADMTTPYAIYALDMANRTTSIIGTFMPEIYEGPIRIIPGNPAYAVTSGGDGCGGTHRVLAFENGGQRLVTTFGVGCVPGPRYIGILNSPAELLAAQPLRAEGEDEFTEYCRFDVLYSYRLNDGSVFPIFDLKKIPGCLREMTYDPVTNHAAIVTENAIYLIDIAARTLIKTFDNPVTDGRQYELYAGKLVGYANNSGGSFIMVMDMSSGKQDRIPWDARLGKYPSFAGRIGDDIYIHALETRTE